MASDLLKCSTSKRVQVVWWFFCTSLSSHEHLSYVSCGLFPRLSHEWQAYISRSHKLRKVFISVKGIYYQVQLPLVVYCFKYLLGQCVEFIFVDGLYIFVLYVLFKAEVEGQKITWLTPHALQQVLPDDDVDFNVMLTFVEVYEVSIDGSFVQRFFICCSHELCTCKGTAFTIFHIKLRDI